MKKILCTQFAALFLICSVGYSQKIDLDKEVWTHNLITLPERGDLSSLKTYSVSMFANQGNLDRLGLTSNKIEDVLKLDGYVYTTGLADIILQITIEDLKDPYEEVKPKETASYEGGKNVTKTTYRAITSYLVPTLIKIINGVNNEILFNGVMGVPADPMLIESEFDSFDQAKASFKGTAEQRLERLKDKYYTLFASVFKGFRDKYDFKIDSETDIFWHIDLKKNPELGEFNEKLKSAKEIFATPKAWDDINLIRERLIPIMQYWAESADRVMGSDKSSRKLRYAYLVNLGKSELWLDMLDEAAITAQKIIENDYSRADGKILLSWVDFFRKQLKISPNNTRHFLRDGFTSSTQFTASEIQPVPFVLPPPPPGFKAVEGTMTDIFGVKHKGALWMKAHLFMKLSFEPNEKTSFVYEKNGSLGEQAMDLNAIEQISLASGQNFFKLPYKGTKMFFQILHESVDINILKYIKSNEGSAAKDAVSDLDFGKEICLMRKSSGEIRSVGAILTKNANKKTAEFYSNCESLKAKILVEEFGKMDELSNQIKAIKFYQQNCK